MLKLSLLLLISTITSLYGVELGSKLKGDIATPKLRIVLGLDATARFKYVENLQTELSQMQKEWTSYTTYVHQKTSELKKQIEELKQVSSNKTSSTTVRKINVLYKLDGIIVEIKDCRSKIIDLLQQHIEFLQQQYQEGETKTPAFEEKSLYSFFDFQNINKKRCMYEEQIHQLLAKKDELFYEIARQEHVVVNKEKDFSTIEQIIDDKKRQLDINKDDIALLDIEKELVIKEREYASLKLNFLQKQQDFLNSKETVVQERLHGLTQQSEIVRSRLYIDVSEVQLFEQKSLEQSRLAQAKKAELLKQRQEISAKKIERQEELDRLQHRFKVQLSSMNQFVTQDKDVSTVLDRYGLYHVASALSLVQSCDNMLHKIKIDITLQDGLEQQASVSSKAVKMLYEIIQGHSKDSETFEQERREYKNIYQSLTQELKRQKEALLQVYVWLKDHQKYIEYLKQQQQVLKNNQIVLSSTQQKKSAENCVLLTSIIQELEQQYEVALQMSELYQTLIQTQEQSLEFVTSILHEFDMIGVWHRSISAVTWEGFKNIIPHLALFLKSFYVIITTYLASITVQKIAYAFASLGFGGMLALFLMMFGWFVLYLFLQILFPFVYRTLTSDDHDGTDPLYRWRHFFAIIVGFCGAVFKPLYFWMLCWLYESLYGASTALLLFFYLYSIIFWIYASTKLLQIILSVNRKFDYFIISKRLIDRFTLIFSFFSIATVSILILRKMFMVVMVHQPTELPNILLRMYHVVIFISIIFSLDKDEMIQLLPKKSMMAQRFCELFERHYYLFLLGVFSVLVMSDPYLGGYGSLLWHVFWNVLLTLASCVAVFVLYTAVKQYSTKLFFYEQSGGVNGVTERFERARAWYIIFVMVSMLVFAVGLIITWSHIWGYGFTYGTLRKIAMYELFKIESLSSGSKVESFKVFNLVYILLVTMLGVIAAYLVRRFVLQPLFDIQYVDPGIQNTITIISRYVIIITAIMIACIHSKLGSLVTYVSYVALVVFGWSFKDLFTDFVAYFFILVQRPVKLGDYVQIDEKTMGVVRKVGPRAVILRRKNAVNIVVPNSMILKSSLYNWNYTRSYIGFDDIFFSVPFGTNIQLVKQICFQVLDEDPDVLKVPQPFVRLQDFGDKGYVFMIRGFLSAGNTLRQWDIASNVRYALVEKLAKAGITIAGPSLRVLMMSEHDIKRGDR